MLTVDDLDDYQDERISESTTEIKGFAVTVYESSESYSKNVTQRLYVDGTDQCFERDGFKIIEYDCYVDVHWCSWREE